jgi:hypothetical protein
MKEYTCRFLLWNIWGKSFDGIRRKD